MNWSGRGNTEICSIACWEAIQFSFITKSKGELLDWMALWKVNHDRITKYIDYSSMTNIKYITRVCHNYKLTQHALYNFMFAYIELAHKNEILVAFMRSKFILCSVSIITALCSTHWGRDNMAAILQTTHSNAFSLMKIFECRLKFHWTLYIRVQLAIFQHWFR